MKSAAIDFAVSALLPVGTTANELTSQVMDQASRTTRILRDLVRSQAYALVAWDPMSQTHRHLKLASDGYSKKTMTHINDGFVANRSAFGIAHRQDTRSLRWRDYKGDWNLNLPDTVTAQEHLLPEGLREGSTMCLRLPDGRYVGAIHMGWTSEAAATDERRELTERFRPILLNLCDQLRVPHLLADELAPSAYALVLSPKGFAFHLANRIPGPHLREGGELRRLILEKMKPWKPRRFVWPDDAGRPHKVTITPCRGNVVLVAEECMTWPDNLSLREMQVLHLVTSGASNTEIAEQLFVSRRTVSTHIEHILVKISCDSRTALAALAVADGLLLAETPSRRKISGSGARLRL